MEIVIIAMLCAAAVIVVLAVALVAKRKGMLSEMGAQNYDVFSVRGNQLTILAGVPATYEIDEILEITFSVALAPKSMSAYNGYLRVVKKNGKKGRPFMFNSSVIEKKTVLASSRQDINDTIAYLTEELKKYHIMGVRRM